MPLVLGERLMTMADLVDPLWRVADVACDHGYLAALLLQRGNPIALAMDISAESLKKAQDLAQKLQLGVKMPTRLSDGLHAIEPQDAIHCAVIGGIGGVLMARIIEQAREKLIVPAALVLQPQNAIDVVRIRLAQMSYEVVVERIAMEKARYYPVLLAQPGKPFMPRDLFEKEFGEVKRPLDTARRAFIQKKMDTVKAILPTLLRSDNENTQRRAMELAQFCKRCEEVL